MADQALPARLPRSGAVWFKRALLLLGALVILAAGAFIAWVPYVKSSNALAQALQHVESGAIPDEPATYVQLLQSELAKPTMRLQAGTYTHLSEMSGVTYNAVLRLGAEGRYSYALTVGNDRVHKVYQHSGRWWVEGAVFHTILIDGDAFLTTPAGRDHKTPARERILASADKQMILQAHYGPPVVFQKVE